METTITITEKTHIYNTFDIYEKFQWSKDGKKCVISDMLCQSCGKRQTLNCKVKEHILTKPTYYSKGYARYDATITIHGEEYSSQKYVELAKKKRKD